MSACFIRSKNRLARLCFAAISLAWFSLAAPAQVHMSAGNYQQSFDGLPEGNPTASWLNNQTLPGWYASRTASSTDVTSLRTTDGSTNTGSLYSFHSAASNDRALGSIASGSTGHLAYGVRFTNDTAYIQTNFAISFSGEQWRAGGNSSTHQLTIAYKVAATTLTNTESGLTAGWNAITGLNFNSPTVNGSARALDGNATTNRVTFLNQQLEGISVQPGEEFLIRWRDVDDLGSDHGLAIDDVAITFTPFSTTPSAQTHLQIRQQGDQLRFDYSVASTNGVLALQAAESIAKLTTDSVTWISSPASVQTGVWVTPFPLQQSAFFKLQHLPDVAVEIIEPGEVESDAEPLWKNWMFYWENAIPLVAGTPISIEGGLLDPNGFAPFSWNGWLDLSLMDSNGVLLTQGYQITPSTFQIVNGRMAGNITLTVSDPNIILAACSLLTKFRSGLPGPLSLNGYQPVLEYPPVPQGGWEASLNPTYRHPLDDAARNVVRIAGTVGEYPGHGSVHPGIDFAFEGGGTNVYAVERGIVTRRTFDPPGIIISHGNGWSSKYLHVNRSSGITEGRRIEKGDLLGRIETDHLHFEMRFTGTTALQMDNPFPGVAVNPLSPTAPNGQNWNYVVSEDLPSLTFSPGLVPSIGQIHNTTGASVKGARIVRHNPTWKETKNKINQMPASLASTWTQDFDDSLPSSQYSYLLFQAVDFTPSVYSDKKSYVLPHRVLVAGPGVRSLSFQMPVDLIRNNYYVGPGARDFGFAALTPNEKTGEKTSRYKLFVPIDNTVLAADQSLLKSFTIQAQDASGALDAPLTLQYGIAISPNYPGLTQYKTDFVGNFNVTLTHGGYAGYTPQQREWAQQDKVRIYALTESGAPDSAVTITYTNGVALDSDGAGGWITRLLTNRIDVLPLVAKRPLADCPQSIRLRVESVSLPGVRIEQTIRALYYDRPNKNSYQAFETVHFDRISCSNGVVQTSVCPIKTVVFEAGDTNAFGSRIIARYPWLGDSDGNLMAICSGQSDKYNFTIQNNGILVSMLASGPGDVPFVPSLRVSLNGRLLGTASIAGNALGNTALNIDPNSVSGVNAYRVDYIEGTNSLTFENTSQVEPPWNVDILFSFQYGRLWPGCGGECWINNGLSLGNSYTFRFTWPDGVAR